MTLDTSGTQSITATDTATSSITGSESGIAVQAAAAKTLAVTGFPTSDTAGTPVRVTVTAYDAYGNVATGYTGTVTLTSSDPHAVLPLSYTFVAADAGQHSFTVTLDTSGTQSITATDTATSSLSASESGIAVQAAAAKTLSGHRLSHQRHGGHVGYGDSHGLRRVWQRGDRLHRHGGSRPAAIRCAVLPAGYTFTSADAGSHGFAVTLDTAGTQSITATDTANTSLTGTETGITVRAIPQVTWSTPASIVYGTPLGAARARRHGQCARHASSTARPSARSWMPAATRRSR